MDSLKETAAAEMKASLQDAPVHRAAWISLLMPLQISWEIRATEYETWNATFRVSLEWSSTSQPVIPFQRHNTTSLRFPALPSAVSLAQEQQL